MSAESKIGKVAEWQFRIESTRDVQFGGALFYGFAGDPKAVVNVVCIGIRLARRAIEAAEFTIRIANVGRIEVAIDVEIGGSPVLLSPYAIGQLSQRRQIVSGK